MNIMPHPVLTDNRPSPQVVLRQLTDLAEQNEDDPQTRATLLISWAATLITEAVTGTDEASLQQQERHLRECLTRTGLTVTTNLMTHLVADAPKLMYINDRLHHRLDQPAACPSITPYGIARIERPLYRASGKREPGETSIGLLEARAGLIEKMTPLASEISARFEAATTSRDATELMNLCGIPITRPTQEKKSGLIGLKIFGQEVSLLESSRDGEKLPVGAHSIVVGMDRVCVPYHEPNGKGHFAQPTELLRQKLPRVRSAPLPFDVNYRQDYIGCAIIRDKHGQVLCSYRYGLGHEQDPRRLARELAADVVWALGQAPALVVGQCQDGERHLWAVLDRAFKEKEELKWRKIWKVVDFWHFWPRADRVIKQVWGEGECEQWKRRVLDEVGAMEQLCAGLLGAMDDHELSDKAHEALDEYLTYVEERFSAGGVGDERDLHFNYAGQRAVGLVVGSGPVEASCKTVVSVRMKRSGCGWKHEGAQAVLTLRALATSSDRWQLVWDHFAKSQVAQVISLDQYRRSCLQLLRPVA